ncbi:MAG: YggS family pyridoxal phosphate-dependent enzyme [Bacteroidales bacterium]|jgi:pyridoxal phosphate enzyme (YggS family)|nr:YggS family pyridoxal phosphate-dependent enzyme [Bacteroidales bacterium]
MSIQSEIKSITKLLPNNIKLVAVSKTKPIEDIKEAYDCGQRLFGENKALEMRDKHAVLPEDISWHFIGHLQTNKVKYIVPFVSMIHSVDSLKLLNEINKEARLKGRIIDCLLEIRIATEETKFGMNEAEAAILLSSQQFSQMENINIRGVMGIGSITDDKEQTRAEFAHLRQIFLKFKERYFANNALFSEISMGMSSDYQIGIEEGATIIRIGSTIFGSR